MSALLRLKTALFCPSGQLSEAIGAHLPSRGVAAVLVRSIVVAAATLMPTAPTLRILSLVLRVVNRERPRGALRHVKPIDIGMSPRLKSSMCSSVVAVEDANHMKLSLRTERALFERGCRGRTSILQLCFCQRDPREVSFCTSTMLSIIR